MMDYGHADELVGEREVGSPSGAYRLQIRSYATDGRKRTQGTIWRRGKDCPIVGIGRDHRDFTHSFVVKDGREWLITGRTVYDQLIVDLDRGLVYEHPPADEFCWHQCQLSPDGRTLAVVGCYWGDEDMIRCFDVSDPARGWPLIPVAGSEHGGAYVSEHGARLAWRDDGDLEGADLVDGERVARTVLHRDGDTMAVIWISPAECQRRDDDARAEADFDAWRAQFTDESLDYRRLIHLTRRLAGVTVEAPHISYLRHVWIRLQRQAPDRVVDVRWSPDDNLIALTAYRDGAHNTSAVQDASRMAAAIAWAAEQLEVAPPR
jgi:hypothetical protein